MEPMNPLPPENAPAETRLETGSAIPSVSASPDRGLGGLPHLIVFLLGAGLIYFGFPLVVFLGLVLRARLAQPEEDMTRLVEQVQQKFSSDAVVLMPMQVAVFAVLVLFLYVLVRFGRGLPFAEGLALRGISGTRSLQLLGGGLALAVLVSGINLLSPPETVTAIEKLINSRTAALLVMGVALMGAPLVEELVFRGYIYTLLERLWGQAPAVVTSGLLFGAIHVPQLWPAYVQMAILFAVGLTFATVRARTGNTTAAILVHLGYNATLSAGFLLSPGFRELASLLP